jgi:hypothetical protein
LPCTVSSSVYSLTFYLHFLIEHSCNIIYFCCYQNKNNWSSFFVVSGRGKINFHMLSGLLVVVLLLFYYQILMLLIIFGLNLYLGRFVLFIPGLLCITCQCSAWLLKIMCYSFQKLHISLVTSECILSNLQVGLSFNVVALYKELGPVLNINCMYENTPMATLQYCSTS